MSDSLTITIEKYICDVRGGGGGAYAVIFLTE